MQRYSLYDMKKTTLDIVLPVYNEEKELSSSVQTLVSFVTQYMKEYLVRIVIADNASIDMTFQIAKELSEKYSIVQAVHFKEKGRGRAVKKLGSRALLSLSVTWILIYQVICVISHRSYMRYRVGMISRLVHVTQKGHLCMGDQFCELLHQNCISFLLRYSFC